MFRAAVRQGREHDAVVEQRDSAGIPREDAVHHRPVLTLQAGPSTPPRQRKDDTRRKYCRQRRPKAELSGNNKSCSRCSLRA